ncbi:FkbM family methyltransferase [Synechocystis sp. LEGE 06083]|uniref:FkbM family methyltransferase n=1 Tax=Synechocystis sp. LEGE 06083 TaxID=915336 RepID=UPI001882C57B|nr:FkbM family methyltransferase [Synechocystis sp. LEGE 06083]MBE9196660.1 FkbM family methyltransferase [Synechocystis sp. LEGE 06083]
MSEISNNFYNLQQELLGALLALERSIKFKEIDLIAGYCEINNSHNIKTVLKNTFDFSTNTLKLSSGDLYFESGEILSTQIVRQLDHYIPRRLLCIPCCPEDYYLGLAVKRLYNSPLCVLIIEDAFISFNNKEKELAWKLFNQANLCLGGSPQLCETYGSRFNRKFWFFPPVIERRIIKTEAPNIDDHNLAESKGITAGDNWSQEYLDKLRKLCSSAGIELDWYGDPNRQLLMFKEEEIAKDGINFKGKISEDELVILMRSANFAVIPTESFDNHGNNPKSTSLSLSYLLCLITAAANLPILALGNPESVIGDFIVSNGLGLVSSYRPLEFSQKLNEILQIDNQKNMRRQSLLLGQNLSVDGVAQWMWDSLSQGHPRDYRFQKIQNLVKVADASVVITLNEVTPRHGTGALIRRVFADDSQIISVRVNNDYGGDHCFGVQSYHFPHYGWTRKDIFTNITHIFADHQVSRIFCVPYSTADVLTAIAIKELFGAPMGIWIMDDQNVTVNNISDALMEEFLQKADVRFATHPELRDAYENKFGLKFWILPAVVPHGLIKTETFQPTSDNCEQKRGALLGSIWSQQWFSDLCHSMKKAGVQLDWYGNSKYYWLTESNEDLQAKGIYPQGLLPEDKLVEKLQEYPFIVVPYGTMDERDDQPQFSQLSLPGRILFALATSNTPVILMGSPKTSAASFIHRFQIGVVCDYTPESFGAAVVEVLDSKRQRVLRENAVAVAEKFGDKNIDSWIWDSLAEGQAADDRFESLFRRSPIDLVHFIEPPVPSLIYKDYAQVYQVMRRLDVNHYRPDFVMDVGASHGIWSHTASQLFPGARFILIDPLINRYEQAARNYYLKNIPQAKFLEIAVSNQSGQLSFQVSPDLYGSSLLTPADFRDYETVTVAVKTLDQVAEEENLQGRGILKLDVQCAEHLVLAGAKNFLEQVDLVVAELSYVRYDENALVFLEMLNLLEQLGFRYYDETGEWRSPIDGTLLQKEVVFIRQDLLMPETSRKI